MKLKKYFEVCKCCWKLNWRSHLECDRPALFCAATCTHTSMICTNLWLMFDMRTSILFALYLLSTRQGLVLSYCESKVLRERGRMMGNNIINELSSGLACGPFLTLDVQSNLFRYPSDYAGCQSNPDQAVPKLQG